MSNSASRTCKFFDRNFTEPLQFPLLFPGSRVHRVIHSFGHKLRFFQLAKRESRETASISGFLFLAMLSWIGSYCYNMNVCTIQFAMSCKISVVLATPQRHFCFVSSNVTKIRYADKYL